MTRVDGPSDSKDSRSVTFTIDGRSFTLEDPSQTAAALLRLAGLDPEAYDLGKFRPGQDEPRRFADDQVIHISEGDRFVSIRQSAPVA